MRTIWGSDELVDGFLSFVRNYEGISRAIHEDCLSDDPWARHLAYCKKQAKLNTPSGKYVDIAPIVKTEEEALDHSGEALLP